MNSTFIWKLLAAAGGATALLSGLVGAPATATAQGSGESDVNRARRLADYVPVERDFPGPLPDGRHWYRFATTTRYWSVVATETTEFGGDVDLYLHDGPAFLGASANLAGESDFIAVDSNQRDLGKYRAKVATDFVGHGEYVIELAQGEDALTRSETIPVAAQDVVLVRDTFLNAGERYYFRVTPSSGVDPDIFLFSPWICDVCEGDEDYLGRATSNPAGVAETFSHLAGPSRWYGIVVTTRGGDGTIVLERYQRGTS